jgi:hypothetical protein
MPLEKKNRSVGEREREREVREKGGEEERSCEDTRRGDWE